MIDKMLKLMKSKIRNLNYFLKDLRNNQKKIKKSLSKEPIFMVSTNRSGSSLLSSLIRQHPDIGSLDDKFIDPEIKFDGEHTFGFSEDFVWQGLEDFNSDHHTYENEGFLWGHPKYLKDFYKENYKFKNSLRKEILSFDQPEKRMFIKHSFFSLRLKLIYKLYPNSQIIFNIRSYKDFIKSNFHKLKKSTYKNAFINNRPDLGLHWLMINTIAYYHLEKYFHGKYIIVNHEKFYDTNVDNQNYMEKITDFLKISKFKFNFKNVNLNYKFDKEIHFEYDKIPNLAKEIADFENKIIK